MSDTPTPTPPDAKPAQDCGAPAIDTLASKIFFCSISFISPAPLAIVIVDFWLRFQGEIPENLVNPLYFVKQGVTGTQFGTLWPLLLAIVPPALILYIIFRDAKSRIIMLALLLVAALLEYIGLAQLSAI